MSTIAKKEVLRPIKYWLALLNPERSTPLFIKPKKINQNQLTVSFRLIFPFYQYQFSFQKEKSFFFRPSFDLLDLTLRLFDFSLYLSRKKIFLLTAGFSKLCEVDPFSVRTKSFNFNTYEMYFWVVTSYFICAQLSCSIKKLHECVYFYKTLLSCYWNWILSLTTKDKNQFW